MSVEPARPTSLLVMHVIVGLEVGGAQLMLKRLVDANRGGTGVHNVVVTLTSLGAIGREMLLQGVPVFTLETKGAIGAPTSMFRLVRLMRHVRPDVVTTWMVHANLLGGLAAKMAGVHRVIWGVRTTRTTFKGSPLTTALTRVSALLSRWVPDAVICAGEAARLSHEAIGFDASRMRVIRNGFDLDALHRAARQSGVKRHELGLSSESIVVGVAGRFDPVKDFAGFLRAVGMLRKEIPALHVVMVGRGLDASNQSLMAWIQAAGLTERVTLLGERSDLPSCLLALDVFCLSSSSEGFPNVVGEAMALGVPCVVTDVGDAAALVGPCGIVVPSGDAVALASGLRRMLQMDKAARQALGTAAQERIRSTFPMDQVRDRFLGIYRSLE